MPMRVAFLKCVAALGGLISLGSAAQAQSCGELWYQRNSIYKSAGYCFRTARAIRAFGNSGCVYDSEYDVPLSGQQRRVVAGIRAAERAQGCSN